MSDHEHDAGHGDHGAGAHEVDKMPSSRLFNLLFGLSALTLVACIGVVQLFYQQVDTIQDTRSAKVSFQLAEYRKEMDELKSGWTMVELTDDDGVPEKQGGKSVHQARRVIMPLSEARKRVLEEPQKYLKAAPVYHRDWPNPDANAPKAAVPTAPGPRGQRLPQRVQPTRMPSPRMPSPPGAEAVDGNAPGQVVPTQPRGAIPVGEPAVPAAPTEGKAPAKPAAPAKGEGKAPAKPAAPAKGEGKAPAKPTE